MFKISIAGSLFRIGVFLVLGVQVALGQDQQPSASLPEPEHAFLKKFVGRWETRWETTAEFPANSGQPSIVWKSVMEAKMLGELWMIAEMDGDMMGTRMNAIITLGFDGKKKKYLGTWVDSIMNHMWHYEGMVEGNTITLNAKGPNFNSPGKETDFQDVYTFKTDDQMEIRSRMKGEDGKWVTFMTAESVRKK
jgi:hypothetical protein